MRATEAVKESLSILRDNDLTLREQSTAVMEILRDYTRERDDLNSIERFYSEAIATECLRRKHGL